MGTRIRREDKDQLLVQTPYGKGLVLRTRKDGVREVQLLEWEKTVRSSRLAVKQYGYGSKSSLKLYSTSDLKSVEPQRGDDVITPFGRGRVVNVVDVVIKKKQAHPNFTPSGDHEGEQSEVDKRGTLQTPGECGVEPRRLTKYQIELSSWRLAGRSKVKCFLFPRDVKVVRKKKLEEMNATERVEFAQRQKASAVSVFKEKQYQRALNLYAGAVDAVRFVQHDASSSNELRADLVEVMVTCSNNAATCCVQLGRWPEAAKFAQNAIVLLDALHNKRGMKIHTILNNDNCLCDAKLFGEWRVKSLLITARACAEKKEYEDAIDILKRARDIITLFCNNGGDNANEGINATDAMKSVSVKHLQTQDKEVRKLLSACMERKKALKKKEKQRAQAMFGGGKKASAGVSSGTSSSLTDQEVETDIEEEKKEAVLESCRGDKHPPENARTDKETKEMLAKPVGLNSSLRPTGVVSGAESKLELKKNVSFSNVVEEREIESDDEEEDAWYEEHKEALLLLGAAGVATLSYMLLRGLKKS
mmetsp:Transcript_16151/g.46593  ORF Transcript_16151/g.46593 Transcript_16151/m.46593 type:complete len:532 (-) Transcript_16151:61-1656(-)